MENELIDEENNIYIEKINNQICLRYKSKYLSENFLNEPTFKKWLDGEKKKKDNINIYNSLYKCKNCNCFSYKKYLEEIKCCEHPKNEPICSYCGSIFYGGSYCCIKRAIPESFKEYLLNGNYTCNIIQPYGFSECAKSLPLVFQITLSVIIFFILFLHRRGSNYENINSNYESRDTCLSGAAIFMMFLTILIYSLIFFIPFSFFHLIYLFFYFKGYKHNLKY